MDFVKQLFCLKSAFKAGHTTGSAQLAANGKEQTGAAPSNASDNTLFVSRLRAELQQEYSKEPRLRPLISILEACDAPDIDFTSSDVDKILADIREINQGIEQAPAPPDEIPIYSTRPFFEDEAAGETTVELVDTENQFSNWGKVISYLPSHTLIVRSIAGLQRVIRWSAQEGKKVRVSGFRHSWSDVFGATGDVMIMFLPYSTLVELPYKQPPADWKSELTGIEVVPSVAGREALDGHAFVKIMAGTTNDQLRQWCFDSKAWCMPCNVIMVEVTFGGTNAPICHGAGLSTSTLSDIVSEVTYVDARGDLQTVNDPAELRAASGAFGLLGVVVSVTLQLDTMGVVDMMPVKLPVALAIPPPKDYTMPPEVKKMCDDKGVTSQAIEEARLDFIRRCENDYYVEWFWFPYQEDVWVNTWSKRPITPQDLDLKAYPGDNWLTGVKSEQVQGTLAEAVINFTPFRWLPGHLQAFLFGAASLFAMPSITDPKDAIQTLASEAMHFRRGIQNFRVWDTEWEIPIASKAGQRDYELIQRAWWDGISAIYSRKDAPVRVALEMRLTGGSNVVLAPQRGNEGTCSIEVLTSLVTPQDDWASFMQQIADKWTGYDIKDEDGHELFPRPHWAKQWAGLQVHGKPVERYFKEDAYKDALPEFRRLFEEIVTKRGSTVEETRARFGNAMMERLIYV